MIRLPLSLTLALALSVGVAHSAEPQSNLNWAVGFQVGSYQPRIDSQFQQSEGSLTAPYEEAFGRGGDTLFNLSFDRHIANVMGPLSIGFGFGYWSVEGSATPPPGAVVEDATDKTTFDMLPLQGQISYRFDGLSNYFPIVPIGRIGVDYNMWQILDGANNVATFGNGSEARGSTSGWHASVGAHLLLDFLDGEMANDFERDAGVKNSFLTFEYRYSQIDDFGAADSFRLGDETFLFGLSLDL